MIIMIIVSIILLILAIVFLSKKEKFLMTLGNYGHAEPKTCFESEPAVRFKNLYICNACSLGCSSKESWDKCEQCQRNLSAKVPAVM